jgi:uncharacterized protein (TIGR03086 family)
MDVKDLHRKAVDEFGARVARVPAGAWGQPTPCSEWNVRALVNHVVGENCWIPPLLGGSTVADVGDALDGDLLGDDPVTAWDTSAAAAREAVGDVELDRTVQLSFGDVPAEEYLWQLTTDALVHAWDLARAVGHPEALPADVVEACARWFESTEDAYRAAGVIGPAVDIDTDTADPQAALLARFGRNPSADEPLAVVVRFNRAVATHDLDAMRGGLTEDCRFVDTTPPDGIVHEGRDAVLGAFDELFTSTPSAAFTVEDGFVHGDRAVLRWRYDWRERGGGHVRGVDLFTVRDGKIFEKHSYVKG